MQYLLMEAQWSTTAQAEVILQSQKVLALNDSSVRSLLFLIFQSNRYQLQFGNSKVGVTIFLIGKHRLYTM